jgi:ABC-type transport system substrate-binding protein
VRTTDLVWQTLGRYGQPATSLLPPGILGHDPGKKRVPIKLEEARSLLESSGVDLPVRLKASVHPVIADRCAALLKAMCALWQELGVEVEVRSTDMQTFLDSFEENEGLDLLITRWNADYDDPDNFTHTLFHSRAGQLKNYFASEESDHTLEEARSESRPALRETLYRKYDGLLQETAAVIPLFYDLDYRIAARTVRGLRLRGSAPYVNYAELSKAEAMESAPEDRGSTKGRLQIPIVGAVNNLDPSEISTYEETEVIPIIFETLTRHVECARIAPALAEDFAVESDGTRYRFRLRPNLRFHDGRRLTSRDVRYSYERLLQRGDYHRGLLSPVRGAKAFMNGESVQLAGFEIHSTSEFTIELDTPVPFFPLLLSHPLAGIIPEGMEEFSGSWSDGCVGTGPFRVVRFTRGHTLELERNPHYWRAGYPKSERLIFNFGLSSKEILAEFRAGNLSLCSDLFPDDAEELRRDPEYGSGYKECPHLSTYYVAFRTHDGPFQHAALRQRLAEAIDSVSLVRETLGRLAMPAHGLIPPGLLGHESSSRSPRPASSAKEQPSLEGLELTVAMHPLFFGKYAVLADAFQAALHALGIKTTTVNETMDEFLEAADKASVDLLIGRWVGDYPDADTFVRDVLHTHEGFLGRLCGTAPIDRLVEEGRAESNPAARHALYRQIEESVARDTLLVPLFHEQVYRFARPELEGLSISYWCPVVRYEDLRIRD